MAKKQKHKGQKKKHSQKKQSIKTTVKEETKEKVELKLKKGFAKKLAFLRKQGIANLKKISLASKRGLATIKKAISGFFTVLWKNIVRLLKLLWFMIEIAGIIALGLLVIISAYSFYYHDKFVPRSNLLQNDLSGLTYEQASNYFTPKLNEFAAENFHFTANGENYQLSLTELGIEYDLVSSLEKAYAKGHSGNFWQQQQERIWSLFSSNEIEFESLVDLNQVKQALKNLIPEIAVEPQDAQVIVNQAGEFEVIPSQSSISTDFLKAYNEIRDNLLALRTQEIELEIREFAPQIDSSAAQLAVEKASLMLSEPVQLLYTEQGRNEEFWIPLPQDKSWIAFEKQGKELIPVLSEIKLKSLLTDEIAPRINREHGNAYIKGTEVSITDTVQEAHYVNVEGVASDGFSLQVDESLTKIRDEFTAGKRAISLLVDFEPGLILDEAERDLGLHELIGLGASDFKGSDANRAYNVAHGTALFNNILIPPRAEFSFNSFLGEVSGRTGWKLAKVIRGNGYIEPDWGGGACQISTTAYRAILDAGLEVTERSPHSLYVSYYTWGPYNEQNDGTGLDATVFLGVKDLKFKNDTPAHILMQTKIEGTKAYFYLYGTKDREVTLDGPHRGAWYSSGAAPILEETTDLAPGEVQITQKALSGFKVYWTQKINYNNGEVIEKTIESNYRATPAFGKIGKSTTPENPLFKVE
ncbi:MAG: VanW family protein [Candidatus Gracilibacteria bacterium]|nr:VanW family protein [Candidatus Gracilibacteria bacterium]